MFRLVFSPSWVLIIAALFTVQGCQTLQSNDGLLEQESSNAKVSSRQLRIVLDDLVLQFSSQVELAADQIIAENGDPQICKNALLWKMNGISSCFQAASRRDPLGSYFDIWILNKQTLALFEQPNNTPLFGESQDIAIAATKQIETSMADVLDLIGDDLPINENFATAFATDHPINDLYFKRASITANYTKYIDSINLKGPELLGIASDIDEQLDQLQRVSSMYAEFIPKQARWNGELMILETLQSNAITSSLQNMSLAASGVATIADTTQAIPELVERGIRNTGTPNFGGAIATAGGVVFIAATAVAMFPYPVSNKDLVSGLIEFINCINCKPEPSPNLMSTIAKLKFFSLTLFTDVA